MSDDLISRQAAINEIKNYDPSQIWDTADVGVWVNALPSAQQWIPCSERLPAEGEPVLLCDRGGCMSLGRLVRTDEGCKWDIGTWWSDIEDGDAWMPLPEPYKGREDK